MLGLRSTLLRIGVALLWATAVPVVLAFAQSGDSNTPTSSPIPRPDLGLSLADLPSGYQEVEGLDLAIFDQPLVDRIMRRTESGPGPDWVWTSTYQSRQELTQPRVDVYAEDLTVMLTRGLADVAPVRGWSIEDASGFGEMASVYSFQFTLPSRDVSGDGALALFGRDNYASLIVVLNLDGDSVNDARNLASIINGRVAAEKLTVASVHATP